MSSAPASLGKLKRLKKANFSVAEKDLLQQEVEQNWKVLTGKLNNQTTNKQKNQIWDSITRKINALGVANRTIVEVRNKWRNTTREAKSVFSKHRAEVNKTGGGPNPKQPSAAVGKVISLLQDTHSFKGIPGGLETDEFDSASIVEDTQDTILPEEDASQELFESAQSDTPVRSRSPSPLLLRDYNPMLPQTVFQPESSNMASTSTYIQRNQSKAPEKTPSRTEKSSRKKTTVQDIYDLQKSVLELEKEKQQKEIRKIELQTQLLERLLEYDNNCVPLYIQSLASNL